MAFKDRVAKINDDLLNTLEQDTRPAAITEEGSITRVEFRSRAWLLFIYFGAIFFVSFLCGVANAVSKHEPFTGGMTRNWPEALLASVLLAVAAFIYFTKQGMKISDSEVLIERGYIPFRRAMKIPVATIRSVKTGSFYADVISLVGKDRYVELETPRRTYRVAWGLSAEQCEAVAEAIRKRTKRLPNSA
jgi:uncharacterized membrane protein YdbT with pleckstrin-like domain